MGVTGLWKLIESSGKPVAFETLEDKVIVIDISIWLHQVVKGYQDGKGGQVKNAHLIGLFNRICKLLYFRIKPIFVFDGKVCSLKYQTIAKRAQQKSKLKTESEKIEALLLESLAKEKVIKEALGIDTKNLIISPNKKANSKPKDEKDSMFMLPEIDNLPTDKILTKTEDDDSFSDSKKSYNLNINKLDLNSSFFKSLAPDIRHDILMDIKETRKQTNWGKMKDLPVESENFSTYQMAGLLRRRQVQVNLEEAEKEMGGKVFSLSELESLLAEDGVLELSSKHAQTISGDENTRFLLVRDIAKAMNEAKERETIKQEPQPSTSKSMGVKSENIENEDDYDLELQKAIQMSLENEESSNSNCNEPVKLNAQQRKKFVGSFQNHGLVKGFMKEYGEMNDEDINDMIDATQVEEVPRNDDSLTQKFPHTDRYVLYGTPEKSEPNESPEKVSAQTTPEKKEIVITVDSKNYNQDEDIFADIFDEKVEPDESSKDKVLDVEVASISDDDTIEYEVPENDILDVDQELKEAEESFSSKNSDAEKSIETENLEAKNYTENLQLKIDNDEETDQICSENEKFWNSLEEIEKKHREDQKAREKTPEKTENQKFYGKTPEKSENQRFYEIDESSSDVELIDEPKNDQKEPLENTSSNDMNIRVRNLESLQKPINNGTSSAKNEDKEAKIIEDKEPVPKSSEKQNPVPDLTEEEELKIAAEALKMEMSADELQRMELDVMKQQKDYAYEKNKLDRFGTSITGSMSAECKELLRLFGIPYIDAPSEAEAQCAFLNAAKLADGIITDDSDVWLFGAKTVYKNFFLQKKVVQKFEMQDIMDRFKIDRKILILIAMFVGSDYTLGLNGVGTVTALEILAEFPPTPEEENGTDIYQSILSSLRKFRDWFENGKQDISGSKKVLKSKLKNVEIIPGFPSINVVKAYLEPSIDESLEEFSWGAPDVESIIEYLRIKIGWTRMKTQEILDPVMKRFRERKQKKMEDYFRVQLKKKEFDTQPLSKRVQKAIGKMTGSATNEDEQKEKKPQKRKITKKSLNLKEKKEIKEIQDAVMLLSEDDEPPEKIKSPEQLPSTSSVTPQKSDNERKVVNAFELLKSPPKPAPSTPKSRKRKTKAEKEPKPSTSNVNDDLLPPKRPPRIPETKQIIPQREKDKKEQEMNKQKAIEIFKKNKKQK